MSIVIAILIFGVIVIVHELGHFWAARRCGILVTEFAIGMGPKLFGIQRGETLYTIRALPLGGFCLMHGDEADPMVKKDAGDEGDEGDAGDKQEIVNAVAASDSNSLNSKPIYQRMFVMFAGSFMNFVLAFIIFTLIAGLTGVSTTFLQHVAAGSPAEAAGLAVGDRITSLNGRRIFLWDDIRFETGTGYGRPIDIGFVRDGQHFNTTVTPELVGNQYLLGLGSVLRVGILTEVPEGFYRVSIVEALTDGFMRIGFVIRTIIFSLTRIFATLAFDQVMGPIGIVNAIDSQYQAAVAIAEQADVSTGTAILSLVLSMANLGAVISANLGLFNLLPLPALDGGRLVFLSLEAIRRKPISPEREGMVHLAGFVILIILAVFIAYQDILNLL